ncbi:UDP-galactose/UDP-glucose transporter 4 [Diplonema papillatum]|nr:UDP-galactose/UDP-glucose transporter 4 [Diplonema papillatum]
MKNDKLRGPSPVEVVESSDAIVNEKKEPEERGPLSHLKYGEAAGSAITGFLTGFLGSMAGVGGGPFCVPLLGWLLGLSHKKCVGTSILCGLTTLIVGGLTAFLSASSLDIPLLPIFVLAAVAPVFGYISAKMSNSMSPVVLKQIFAWFLFFTAVQIIWKMAYSPTGVEGHWSYTLEDKDGQNQRDLVYEIEPANGELIFRTEHFGGILQRVTADVINARHGRPIPTDFEDGWYTVLRSKKVELIGIVDQINKGTMWVKVLDRGTTMVTVYESDNHLNAAVIATRVKSWFASLCADMVRSETGNALFHLGIALIAGTASGLLGIAGGSVVVPLMSLTGAFPWQVVTTTSLLSMIPTSFTTCYTHHLNGNVALRLAPGLVMGTIVGAFTGSRLMAFTTEIVRKTSCAGVLMFTACIMLYQGMGKYFAGEKSSTFQFLRLAGATIFFLSLGTVVTEKVFNRPDAAHEYMLTFSQKLLISLFAAYDLRFGRKALHSSPTASSQATIPQKDESLGDRKPPVLVYLGLAALLSTAAFATGIASKLLDFSTQAALKSAKLPLMMVWRLAFLQTARRPSLAEWVCGLGVAVGFAMVCTAGATVEKGLTTDDAAQGVLLLIIALAADASLYALEEGVVFGKYKADKVEAMLYISTLSLPFWFAMLVHSGALSLASMWTIEWKFPTIVIASAAAHYIGAKHLLQIVQEYDANMAIFATTFNKLVSVIISFSLFPAPVTLMHVVGIVVMGFFSYGFITRSDLTPAKDKLAKIEADLESGAPPNDQLR